MQRIAVFGLFVVCSLAATAQQLPVRQMFGPSYAESVSGQVNEAAKRLVDWKKLVDGDLEALALFRAADVALTDPMQPSVAIQKALDAVLDAKRALRESPFNMAVRNGAVKMEGVLEDARRSPADADFERLRVLLREHCTGPATRLVAGHAAVLHEETVAWIAAQERIATHLRQLTETAAATLRAIR